VSDLQFGPLAGNDRPIFRPVELERFARQKRQRHDTPRLLVFCSCCRAAFQSRAKAATRLSEPS
jgi:hypothetical protein